MRLQDLGAGGFAIVCARPFVPGSQRLFGFLVSGHDVRVSLPARAVYSQVHSTASGLEFRTGWAFVVGPGGIEHEDIGRLVGAVGL
jgi:hypothetical protein